MTITEWCQIRAFRNGRKDWRTWMPWDGMTYRRSFQELSFREKLVLIEGLTSMRTSSGVRREAKSLAQKLVNRIAAAL